MLSSFGNGFPVQAMAIPAPGEIRSRFARFLYEVGIQRFYGGRLCLVRLVVMDGTIERLIGV